MLSSSTCLIIWKRLAFLRLATREAGVQSAPARGARRPKSRYGTALDLFASGTAEIYVKPGRELHTLASFDVTIARPAGC